MEEIIVKTQTELDAVPVDYNGRIIVKFGTPYRPANVKNRYKYFVEAWGNATVRASENATVRAWENATVRASGNATVRASENATVRASGNATVEAWGNATVEAWGNATVRASENATVRASGNATVVLSGFAQAVRFGNASCKTNGKSRVIEPTKDIETFMLYHNISTDGEYSIWYKAVRRYGERYCADRNGFEYEIGKTATLREEENLDRNRTHDCGTGLHVATLKWALEYGADWKNLAILECRVKNDEIILPFESTGKVRVPHLKVIREVPLKECGILGKILAKKNGGAK